MVYNKKTPEETLSLDLELDYIEQWKTWFSKAGRSRKQFNKNKYGNQFEQKEEK